MCCINRPYVWNGTCLRWNHTSLRQTKQRKSSIRVYCWGPWETHSHIVWSACFFPPPWKLTKLSKKIFIFFFWSAILSFHSIIPSSIAPTSQSVLYHLLSQTFISLFLSLCLSHLPSVRRSSVRLSTTQALFMQTVCTAGQSCTVAVSLPCSLGSKLG